jgi:predicted transcriptional regulator
MAKELIQAQIEAGQLSVDDMQDALQKTYASLVTLQAKETSPVETPSVPTDWRKSITQHAVTCLECGQSFKQLTRHLRDHELDARLYRAKYGIPRTQPLSARSVTAMRKTIAQKVRPWEKTSTYVKAQEEKPAVAKKGTRKKGVRAKG